jgi:general secretion pathway protein J
MQGVQTLRNDAYFFTCDLQVIRRNDEVRSATPQARRALQGMGVFQQPRSGGFTLVEILIAIFILGLVMATVYASYSGILTTSHTMEEELDIYKMARAAMDRMIKDLSSLQTSSGPAGSSGSFDLRSEKKKLNNIEFHSLSFWSASHLAFGENQGEGRPAMIGYRVQENDDRKSYSLWRSDESGAKPVDIKNTQEGFIICKNIDTFRLTFYDANGAETDSWDSSSESAEQKGNAPAAVKIELFLVNQSDQEKPYKFMTKVFLPAQK